MNPLDELKTLLMAHNVPFSGTDSGVELEYPENQDAPHPFFTSEKMTAFYHANPHGEQVHYSGWVNVKTGVRGWCIELVNYPSQN